MKYLIFGIIAIILIVVFAVFKRNSMTVLENKWTAIKNSQTDLEEKESVIEMYDYMKGKASYSLVAIEKNGVKKKVATEDIDENNLKEITISVQLKNGEEFKGLGWKPKDLNNIYVFFRE